MNRQKRPEKDCNHLGTEFWLTIKKDVKRKKPYPHLGLELAVPNLLAYTKFKLEKVPIKLKIKLQINLF